MNSLKKKKKASVEAGVVEESFREKAGYAYGKEPETREWPFQAKGG